MVPMRIASDNASVETPSSAATSGLGTIRSSGRSSSAVETTLAINGIFCIWLVRSAAVRVTAEPSRPETTSISPRWPLSFMNHERTSGTSASAAPKASLRSDWLRLRSSVGTRPMISVALRISALPPWMRPPSTKILFTSGKVRRRSVINLVAVLVSSSLVPGGSSSASSTRELSSAGRKPDGSSFMERIEAAKKQSPSPTVLNRLVTDQRTRRV